MFQIVLCLFYMTVSVTDSRYSIKTSYRKYHNLNEKNLGSGIPNGTRFQYLYGMFRHANRYCSRRMYNDINKTFHLISESNYKMDDLRREFAHMTMEESSGLNHLGLFYTFNLAKRFVKRMPELKEVDLKSVFFTSSYTTRAALTMSAFVLGFTQSGQIPHQKVLTKAESLALRFYDACTVYNTDTKVEAKAHLTEFMKHELFKEMVDRVRNRISNTSKSRLTLDDVTNLYDFCALCDGQYVSTSNACPCHFFEKEDLDLLEYADDMELYYYMGKEYDTNIKMAVGYVNKIVENVRSQAENCASNTPNPQVEGHFTHAEALLPVMGVFGLLDSTDPSRELDLKLTPENYEILKGDKRFFKGEKFVPYGANLVFVVTCPHNQSFTNSPMKDSSLVMAFLNEKNVALKCNPDPNLAESGVFACPVKNFVKAFIQEESFDDICTPNFTGLTCPTNLGLKSKTTII